MISAEMLVFIISAFCQFKNPQIPREVKLECSEYLVNCIVQKNGETTNKIVNECKENYADKEVRKRSGRL